MKTKVLIVGNSHVAAVRNGWKLIASEFPRHRVKFFAANSTLYQQLEFSDDLSFGIHDPEQYETHQIRFMKKSVRRLTVDMKAFDLVLVVGQNSNEVDFLRQFEDFSIDGVRERPGQPQLSQEAFVDFCDEIVRKRLPEPDWHNWEHPKLFFLPVPIPRADCPIDSERYGIWARYGRDPQTGLSFLKSYRERVAAIYGEIGIGMIDPPDNVYDPETGLTQTRFGTAANKLAGMRQTYEEDDYHHMNAKYGSIVLRHALQTLPVNTSTERFSVLALFGGLLRSLRGRIAAKRSTARRRRVSDSAMPTP